MDSQDLEYRVGKLALKPGDVLVVKTSYPMTDDDFTALRASLGGVSKELGFRALILPHDVDLSVLTGEEIATRTVGAPSPTPQEKA